MTDTPSERLVQDLFSYWLRELFPWPDGEWWTEAPEDDRWEFVSWLFNRVLDQWWEPFDEYRYPHHAVPKRNPATALLYGLAYMDGYRPGAGKEFRRHALPVTKVRSTELAEAIGVDTRTLAELLRDAGVDRPRQMRFPPGANGKSGNTKGYNRIQFFTAWQHDDGRFQSETIRISRENGDSVRQMLENSSDALYIVRTHPEPLDLLPA